MAARGENYCVKFMRRKTQTQHRWKQRQEWIVAEYDVQECVLNDRDLEKWPINTIQEVKFNEMKKEIEVS